MDKGLIETMEARADNLRTLAIEEEHPINYHYYDGQVNAYQDILLMLKNEEREVSSDGDSNSES